MSDTPGKEVELCIYLYAVVGTTVSFSLETTHPATVFVTCIPSAWKKSVLYSIGTYTRTSFRQKISLLFTHFGFFTVLSNKDSSYLFVLHPSSFPRGRHSGELSDYCKKN